MSPYFRFQAIVGSLIVTTLLFCDAGTKSRPHPHKGVRLLIFDWFWIEQMISKYLYFNRLASCRFSNHSPVIILHTIYLRTKTKNWKQENRYPIFINNIVIVPLNLWINVSCWQVIINQRNGKSGGAIVLQDVNAPPNLCMDRIRDLGFYHKVLPSG